MRCSQCEHDLPATAQFCPSCGAAATAHATPAPPTITAPQSSPTPPLGSTRVDVGAATRRRSVAPLAMAIVVLVALVGGGIAVIASRDGDTDVDNDAGGQAGRSAPTVASTAVSTDTTTTDATTTATTTTPTTTTTTSPTSMTITTTLPPDPNEIALTALAAEIDGDRPAVDLHLERWVPQISAKRVGLRWEGVDYELPQIIELHRELDARYGALLVSGSEYHFLLDDAPMAGWFITIVDQSWLSPDGALDWCRANSIDRDNCAAKLITNDPDPGRTLVLQ